MIELDTPEPNGSAQVQQPSLQTTIRAQADEAARAIRKISQELTLINYALNNCADELMRVRKGLGS